MLKLAHSRLEGSDGARDNRGPAPSRVRVYRHAEERGGEERTG